MPVLTILFGVGLMAVGIGTYIGAGEGASIGAFLLQLILGLLAVGLGVGSMVKKEMRMHLMHGAVILAAMGVIVPTIKFGMYLFDLPTDEQMKLLRVVLTVALSGAYVYAAVKSFRKARANRVTGSPPPAKQPEAKPDPAPAE
ncbi:MAG: hypothetical protein AAF711_02875 [Planctomycetota bacterium]